jgi:hypothetical protein
MLAVFALESGQVTWRFDPLFGETALTAHAASDSNGGRPTCEDDASACSAWDSNDVGGVALCSFSSSSLGLQCGGVSFWELCDSTASEG